MNNSDVFDDDFLNSELQDNNNISWKGNMFWKRIKFWWFRNIVHGKVGNSIERIGIPLYDLNSEGHEMHEEQFQFGTQHTKLTGRKLKISIFSMITISISVFLIVQILKSSGNHYSHKNLFSNSFNPSIKYNNGTNDFYPINIVIKINELNTNQIVHDSMPLLTRLYTGDISDTELIMKNNSIMSCIDGMESSFPLLNDANIWSMMTGVTPSNHGVIYNGDNCTNTEVMPIWLQMETKFQNFKVAIDSEIINNDNYKPSYYLDRDDVIRDKDMIEWIIELIDYNEIDTRPQLIMGSLIEYSNEMRYNNDEDKKTNEIDKLNEIDYLLTILIIQLTRRKLMDFTNIIITSDYGFSDDIRGNNILNINNIINDDIKDINKLIEDYRVDDNMMSLYINNKNKNEVYNKIIQGPYKDMISVQLKGKLPKWYDIGTDENKLGDIIIIPNDGYGIISDNKLKQKKIKLKLDKYHYYKLGGNYNKNHGALFIGIGPFFQQGDLYSVKLVRNMKNTVVYEIIAEMCGLGSRDRNMVTSTMTTQWEQISRTSRTTTSRTSTTSSVISTTAVPVTRTDSESATQTENIAHEIISDGMAILDDIIDWLHGALNNNNT